MEQRHEEENECYGTFVVLGASRVIYNEHFQLIEKNGQNERFILRQRLNANGIKEERLSTKQVEASSNDSDSGKMFTPLELTTSFRRSISTQESSSSSPLRKNYSILMNLESENQQITISFVQDQNSDLFQFGRSSSQQNDFVIGGVTLHKTCFQSRHAFRILANRKTRQCRIFAGGFDDDGKLIIGERALMCVDKQDALITNGLRVMFDYNQGWTEVSCRGNIHAIRSIPKKPGNLITSATNELKDGSLVSCGGITLMWRSSEGLAKTRYQERMQAFINTLNQTKIRCPKCLKTIRFLVDQGSGQDASSSQSMTPTDITKSSSQNLSSTKQLESKLQTYTPITTAKMHSSRYTTQTSQPTQPLVASHTNAIPNNTSGQSLSNNLVRTVDPLKISTIPIQQPPHLDATSKSQLTSSSPNTNTSANMYFAAHSGFPVDETSPYVFVGCGHVFGFISEFLRYSEKSQCPLCKTFSHYMPLKIPNVGSLFFQNDPLCVLSCGHVIGKKIFLPPSLRFLYLSFFFGLLLRYRSIFCRQLDDKNKVPHSFRSGTTQGSYQTSLPILLNRTGWKLPFHPTDFPQLT